MNRTNGGYTPDYATPGTPPTGPAGASSRPIPAGSFALAGEMESHAGQIVIMGAGNVPLLTIHTLDGGYIEYGPGYTPDAAADAFWGALSSAGRTPGGEHAHHGVPGNSTYLSTGCLHGHHDYCQNQDGQAGPKTPATCKWCPATCQCPCHDEGQS